MNVLSIQSEVVYGHVGNSAARFALQRLGHEAWCVPTIILSSHPGHKGFAGEATSAALLGKLVDALGVQGRFAEADGVISGYLGSPEQAEIVAATVRAVKSANPAASYCLDSVFGDDGRIYARPGVAEAMAQNLLPLADIVTPNAFELSTLAGLPVRDASEGLTAAQALHRPIVVATSVPHEGRIGTLVVAGDEAWLASTPKIENAPRGPGDLFAALFFGQTLNGRTPAQAMELAARATYHVLAPSAGAPEMRLVAEQDALVLPPRPADFRLEKLETRRLAVG
ncbi:MAG TPA: pyridoxal kinase [Devosiaceae bacterium]|nr:pyridoxal kinase [Devosiaceae bacterium]